MVKPYFFPELWITIGWWGLAAAIDESRLGDESRDDERSDDREWGDIGLPKGETPNTSGKKICLLHSEHTQISFDLMISFY